MIINRNSKLDFMRFTAIILVLIIHSWTQYAPHSSIDFIIRKWLPLFSRPCIAIFLFLAGFLFRTDNLNLNYLFQKYKRVVLPYLCFSVLVYFYIYKDALINYILEKNVLILINLLLGRVWGIHFFIFLILFMYTLSFIVLKNRWLKNHISHLSIVFLILNLLHGVYYYPIEDILVEKIKIEWQLFYVFRSPFIWTVFFFFGLLFKSHNWQKVIDAHLIFLRFLWVFVFFLYNLLVFLDLGNIAGYNSVIGTIYSLSTICFLLTFNVKHRLIYFIGKISFFLYLSHMFFVFGLSDIIGLFDADISFFLASFTSFIVSIAGPILLFMPIKKILKDKSFYFLGA